MRQHWTGIALALTLGCQDYLFEQKCPETVIEKEITRAAGTPKPADILFVVDNSGSMLDEQENLAANFGAFIDEIVQSGTDYRIAVVTTDQEKDGKPEQRGEVVYRYEPEPGTGVNALVSADITGCDDTGIALGCFRGPSSEERVIDSTMDQARQTAAFRDNVKVGSCGSGEETGVEAMVDALRKMRGGCNSGFLREEANLVVILVSDEDEDIDSEWLGNTDDLSPLFEELEDMKPLSQTRVAVIVGSQDGEPANCSTDLGSACGSLCSSGLSPQPSTNVACNSTTVSTVCEPHEICLNKRCTSLSADSWDLPEGCLWCTFFRAADCCSALAGTKYVEFARQFEQRVAQLDPTIDVVGCRPTDSGQRAACLIDTICQDSFADTLQQIARDLVITSDYNLNPPALNPEGVRVRLTGGRWGEGTDLTAGEQFDILDDGRLLRLNGGAIPAPGENLEIYYVSEVVGADEPHGACGL